MLLRLDSENLSTLQQFFRILFSYGNVSSNTSDECTLCPIEIEFSHEAVEKWFHVSINGSKIEISSAEEDKLKVDVRTRLWRKTIATLTYTTSTPVDLRQWGSGQPGFLVSFFSINAKYFYFIS